MPNMIYLSDIYVLNDNLEPSQKHLELIFDFNTEKGVLAGSYSIPIDGNTPLDVFRTLLLHKIKGMKQ